VKYVVDAMPAPRLPKCVGVNVDTVPETRNRNQAAFCLHYQFIIPVLCVLYNPGSFLLQDHMVPIFSLGYSRTVVELLKCQN